MRSTRIHEDDYKAAWAARWRPYESFNKFERFLTGPDETREHATLYTTQGVGESVTYHKELVNVADYMLGFPLKF